VRGNDNDNHCHDWFTHSSIFAWFLELLAGLSTIRAFSQIKQSIFTAANQKRVFVDIEGQVKGNHRSAMFFLFTTFLWVPILSF
jgi:hypothetical protein